MTRSSWKLWFLVHFFLLTISGARPAENASISKRDESTVEIKSFSISEDKQKLYAEISNVGSKNAIFSKDQLLNLYCNLRWTLRSAADDQHRINGGLSSLQFSNLSLKAKSSIVETKGKVEFENDDILMSPKSSIGIEIDVPSMIRSVDVEIFFSKAKDAGLLERINTADVNCTIMVALPFGEMDSRDIALCLSKRLRLGSVLQVFGDVSSKLGIH